MDDHCAECGRRFTLDEWDVRHSRSDGEDVHEWCCDLCPPELPEVT